MGGEWWTWNVFISQLFHPTSTLVNNWLKIIIPGRNGLRTNFCKSSHYFHPCFSGASQNMAAGKIDYFIAIFLPYSPYKLDSKTRDVYIHIGDLILNNHIWGFGNSKLCWQNYHSHALQRWLGETVLTPTSSYDHQQMNPFLDVIVGKHKAKWIVVLEMYSQKTQKIFEYSIFIWGSKVGQQIQKFQLILTKRINKFFVHCIQLRKI